jgi:glutamine synthetase
VETKGKRLRLLYPDLHGLDRGKYLFEDQNSAFCIGVYPLTFDREILLIPGLQFDVGLPDMDAQLDESSLRPCWEPDTVVGVADIEFRGKPLPIDPRGVLRTAVQAWEEMGLTPQAAYEYEFWIMEPDGEGGWRTYFSPGSRVYGTGISIDPKGIVDEMVRTAIECDFAIESWNSEYDDAQFEVNLHYRDAIPAADDAFLFRLLTREVAARRGMRCTYMGRPFADRSGSGCHYNFSFRREDGSNAIDDPSAPDGISTVAKQCIAGILAHHQGLAAICAPYTNAYKRLLPDMLNGYWANWGYDDRSVGIRVPPNRGGRARLEQRTPDASSNPYLIGAAILHAARLGVVHELELPEPQTVGEPPNTDVRIPPNLNEALEAFQADTELCEALGPDLVTAFTMLKRAEWERYLKADPTAETADTPAEWELEYYMPFF